MGIVSVHCRRRLWRGAKRLAWTLPLLLGAGGSCMGDGVEAPQPCTAEARASVMVSVVDARANPLPGAAVTWRANGGDPEPAVCADYTSSPAACTRFVAGWEVAGTIEVRAEKLGFLPATGAVTVVLDESGCHVLTRDVSLVMLPVRGPAP